MREGRIFGAVLVGVLAVTSAGLARAACDVEGVDAAAIGAARDAIDEACPCAAATSRGVHRRCALEVVRAREAALQLPKGCRRETVKHAKLSICGRPGAAVCCRVRADGRTRHKIVSDPARCVSTTASTACVSAWQSVPAGCDASGCVPLPAICGNGVVEVGETCDPPTDSTCSSTCQTLTCVPPPGACGNGTIDPGEACEPPGVAGCFRDCQLAPCAAAQPGEIDVACVSEATSVGVGATASSYLLAWSGAQRREGPDVLVRRFDANGLPLDPDARVVSEEACFAFHRGPAVASDGVGFYAVWEANGAVPDSGAPFEAMYGRRIDAAGGAAALEQLAFNVGVGSCRYGLLGPTMAAGVSPARFAGGWVSAFGCGGSIFFQSPVGVIRDFNSSPPLTQGVAAGYGNFEPPPGTYSLSAASVATLGPDTLWVSHAGTAASVSGPFTYFVASTWTDSSGSTGPVALTGRRATVGGRPSVSAGAAALLVAWSQGATDTAAIATEIRAVRVTRASGSLDPDGGLLLATTSGHVSGGPAVAFDGTRWLVVWAERSGGTTSDLRAVAVSQDGTVVDASPRIVATNVLGREPAAASTGDGRVLVVYGRADGAVSAVRATLVTP